MDVAIRIRSVMASKRLQLYVPFAVSLPEIEDVSLLFEDRKILQATFSAACIIDFMKNEHTSEIAYNGKTVDIAHISTLDVQTTALSGGTLLCVDLEKLHPFLANDEVYLIWRMPHKSLNEIFKPRINVGNVLDRLRDLITTPVITEKFGYSIRINEARLLPEAITKIGAFHRQKMRKAVITLSIDESYELNDGGCYRIRRLEENLYRDYLPKSYPGENTITYQWQQTRDDNLQGHFNFYYSITKNAVSRSSMILYMLLLLVITVVGEIVANLVQTLIGLT